MTLTQEVYSFSADYINHPQQRTQERNLQIQSAYRILTGENLRSFCGTCLIEALFKIRKIMEQKERKYELKPGAVLEAFGDPSTVLSNKTEDSDLEARGTTFDNLAAWHLKTNPGLIKFFSKVPDVTMVPVPASNKPADTVTQAEKDAAVEAEREEKAKELEAERKLKTDELEAERNAKAAELEAERVLKEKQTVAKKDPPKPAQNKAKK